MKYRKKQQAAVISQKELVSGIYDLQLSVPDIAAQARAGQFVSLYCADKSRLLPRPVSLAGIGREEGTIRLIYRVSGAGTEEFSRLQPGDTLELLGPLGNGFPVETITGSREETGTRVFLIGGGIGIPPLLETAKALKDSVGVTGCTDGTGRIQITAVLGYRDSSTFLSREFNTVCDHVLIASEDGSIGTKGTVLDALREAGEISERPGRKNTVWFACGPTPMLRALKTCAEENGISCWLSLEERMACGVGACLACVCRTADTDEHSQVKNRRICKDGPVFRAEEIEL